jgi:hypothetical protein
MAFKIGIVGDVNTGKSYSRKFIEKGDEVFIIAPSQKATHMTTSDGKPFKKLVRDEKGNYVSGNYVVNGNLQNLISILNFVDKNIPHIKTLILPDFTHFISAVLSDDQFIRRKSGGEAFQRFWELSADALNSFIRHLDNLRDDLLIITEYHQDYDEVTDSYKIFVPGGKMLEEKFKLESYYEFLYFTHIEKNEQGEVDSYNFVTKRWGKYNARCSGIFKETLIPNNLEIVLKKTRKYLGI